MKVPEKINILGVDHKVELVDVVDKENLCLGQIDYMKRVIRIDRTIAEDMQMVTLVHEVLHGICNLLGLDDINENESAIQSLATALYSTFGDGFISS